MYLALRKVESLLQCATNYFALAKIYEDAGAYEEAEKILQSAKQAKPSDPAVYMTLAALYRRSVVLPAIDRLLREDRLRPVYLMETVRTRVVADDELRAVDPDLQTLRNLNSPADYERALADAGLARLGPSGP